MKELVDKLMAGELSPSDAVKQAEAIGNRVYPFKTPEERIAHYVREKAFKKELLAKSIPFMGEGFMDGFRLLPGLTLIGAQTGQSKSTTCANILAGYHKAFPGRPAVIISNEEKADTIYDRVSCILHRLYYVDIIKGRMKKQDQEKVEKTSIQLAESIEVIDDRGGAWDMAVSQNVQCVLEGAAQKGIGLVLLDYYQTVLRSQADEKAEAWRVLKDFGIYLKDYGRRFALPIVVFAQLKPKEASPAFTSRVQNDTTIANHAPTVIEIIPNFETAMTKFFIHKDRLGEHQGKGQEYPFDRGRYVLPEPLTEENTPI